MRQSKIFRWATIGVCSLLLGACGSGGGGSEEGTQVVQMAGGATHSVFLKSDGTLWSCGNP